MKWPSALLAGFAAALGLFVLMQALIERRNAAAVAPPAGAVVDMVRLRPDTRVRRKEQTRPPPPPPPARQPPPPPVAAEKPAEPPPLPRPVIAIREPDVPAPGGGPYLGDFARSPGSAEGDVVPVVRFAPRYPREARSRRLEGWVRVRFTIGPDGSVSDARVVEAQPGRIFNREALRAIGRWKFKPRIVDGRPVAREAEQLIEFSLGQP